MSPPRTRSPSVVMRAVDAESGVFPPLLPSWTGRMKKEKTTITIPPLLFLIAVAAVMMMMTTTTTTILMMIKMPLQ